MIKWTVTGLLAAAGIILGADGCIAATVEKVSAPKEYLLWLEELKSDMKGRGISLETLADRKSTRLNSSHS